MTYKEKFDLLPENFVTLCEEAGLLAEYEVATAAAMGEVSQPACKIAASAAEKVFNKSVLHLKKLNNLLSGETPEQWEHRCGAEWDEHEEKRETALTLLAFFRHETMRRSTQCK